MQGDARERAGQHGAQVAGQVVLPAIEQVLQVQAGLRFALDREAALEEERIGILAAAGKVDEVLQRTADRHMGRAHRAPEAAAANLERKRQGNIIDTQADALAGKFVEAFRERLASQQLVDREHQQARLQGRGRAAQDAPGHGDGIGHGNLPGNTGRHSCHGQRSRRLRSIKAGTRRGADR